MWANSLFKMRQWLFLATLVLLAILQSTLLFHLRLWGAGADFLLIAVGFVSFKLEITFAILWSLFLGGLKDVLSGLPYGLSTVVFPLYALIFSFLKRRFNCETIVVQSICVFFVAFINAFFCARIDLSEAHLSFQQGIILRMIAEACLTALWLKPVFFFLSRVNHYNISKEASEDQT